MILGAQPIESSMVFPVPVNSQLGKPGLHVFKYQNPVFVAVPVDNIAPQDKHIRSQAIDGINQLSSGK